MKIEKLTRKFGRDARNLITDAGNKNTEGAVACLETFYYAFNNKDLDVFKMIWLNHELIQLNNPLGGIVRGIVPITEIYSTIFHGQADVWVELGDIVSWQSGDMAVFAGTETGEFTANGQTLNLKIRTTRFFGYDESARQWFQVHHHGSIDSVDLLDRYQKAVRK
ncbi:MAG: nuclear transport factor 2 family protein [Bacteroidales bacterium]|nr:nuclear transport factor 2 family protein [Bacteroidales bacterium]